MKTDVQTLEKAIIATRDYKEIYPLVRNCKDVADVHELAVKINLQPEKYYKLISTLKLNYKSHD